MANPHSKLEHALRDLIDAYTALEAEAEENHGDDEEAFASSIIDALETALESAIEEQDSSTGSFATVISSMSEALEQLDPSAFEGIETEEDEEADVDDDDEDIDYDLDDDDEDVEDDE